MINSSTKDVLRLNSESKPDGRKEANAHGGVVGCLLGHESRHVGGSSLLDSGPLSFESLQRVKINVALLVLKAFSFKVITRQVIANVRANV